MEGYESSSNSSTSSPARARPSCAPSSSTCCPARSWTRPSTPASRWRRRTSTSGRCSTSTRRAPTSCSWTWTPTTRSTCPAETVGDDGELPAGERRGDGGHARRRAAVHRAPGRGRDGHHLHRARPAGRPLHRRHQAGHRGDRRRDPGPAVHLHRREGQGGHPRRQVPRPDQQLTGRPGAEATRDLRGSGNSQQGTSSRAESSKGVDPSDILAGSRVARGPSR